MSAFQNAFGDKCSVIPGSLPHVRNHLGDGIVVVIDDVDAGLSPVPPVHFPLPLEHEVKVKRVAITPLDNIVIAVVGVIAICCC